MGYTGISRNDGLIYTWSDGRRAGMPEDTYKTFIQNRHLYVEMNKPIPYYQSEAKESDGSVWVYRFSFDDPFNYFERQMFSPPIVTESGDLIEEPEYIEGTQEPGTGELPEQTPGEEDTRPGYPSPTLGVPNIDQPDTTTSRQNLPGGGEVTTPVTSVGQPGNYSDLIPVIGMGLLCLGFMRPGTRTSGKRRKK